VTVKRNPTSPSLWHPATGVVRTMGLSFGLNNLLEVFASHVFDQAEQFPVALTTHFEAPPDNTSVVWMLLSSEAHPVFSGNLQHQVLLQI
jgi:hypothetical protein